MTPPAMCGRWGRLDLRSALARYDSQRAERRAVGLGQDVDPEVVDSGPGAEDLRLVPADGHAGVRELAVGAARGEGRHAAGDHVAQTDRGVGHRFALVHAVVVVLVVEDLAGGVAG